HFHNPMSGSLLRTALGWFLLFVQVYLHEASNRSESMSILRVSLAFLCCLPLCAQTNGNISGYVKDPTGAVVNGAKITVRNQQTGALRTAATDETGFYQVLGLVSGAYSVEAEAPGFKRSTAPDVSLGVDANVRADVALQLGQVTDSVEVTS